MSAGCNTPPSVSNGVALSATNTSAQFQCSSGYKMSGSASVTCDSTSGWGTLPACVVIYPENHLYASFAPDWLLILLAVLFSLLTLACLGGLIWCCCCKPATVYPLGGGGGVYGSSRGGCCPCGNRSHDPPRYHDDDHTTHKQVDHNVHHTTHHNTSVTATHSITGQKKAVYPSNNANGVYTTSDGLLLVEVSPFEVDENHGASPPPKNMGNTNRYYNNGSTPRSETRPNDVNTKKNTPEQKWMPHSKNYRQNNTSTH